MRKLTILLVLVLVTVLTGCNGEESELNSLEKVLENGYLTMGLDDTFAPMGFRDTDGEITGFDVELGQAVAERLGVELKLQPIEWDSKVLELNAGNIDMIWNGLTITDSRLEEMSFSDAYLANSQIIITKKDSTIDTVNDLIGKKVGVQISSASEDAVTANSVFDQLGELVKYDTFNLALLELSNGYIKIDGVDISRLNLFQLRTQLSIIPQFPVLFQGTLRENLEYH